jgi:hypothetical protein
MQMIFPEYNQVYTLEEIINVLSIPDMPSLNFEYNNNNYSIDIAQISTENLLNIPGMKESKWKFHKTTHEWIPIFYYADDHIDINNIVDFNKYIDYNKTFTIVNPKGYKNRID